MDTIISNGEVYEKKLRSAEIIDELKLKYGPDYAKAFDKFGVRELTNHLITNYRCTRYVAERTAEKIKNGSGKAKR